MQKCKYMFNLVKDGEIYAKFCWTDLKISLNIFFILLTFADAMQIGQNLRQLPLRPLTKFVCKVTLGLDNAMCCHASIEPATPTKVETVCIWPVL